MHFKKIMSGILTLALSASCFTFSVMAEKVVIDFENDQNEWYNGGEGGSGSGYTVSNVSVNDIEENGNTFKRMKFDVSATNSDNQVGSVLHMPSASLVLDEPIEFVDGQIVKISSKIRSNNFGSNYRVMPGIAINLPEKAYKKEVIETLTGGIHGWNKLFNAIYKVDYSNGTKVFDLAVGNSQWGATAGLNWGAYWMIPSSTPVSGNLSANTWYKVDSYLIIGKIDGVAKIEKVRTVVNDGALGDVTTVVNSNTQYGKVSLQNETNISSLHLFTGYRAPAGTKTDLTIDFDDITIDVIVKGNINLCDAKRVDGGIEWYLKSDIVVDNPEEIYLHDGMGGIFDVDVSYDEDTGIITVRSDESLSGITYAISGMDKLKSNGAVVEEIADIMVGVPEELPIEDEFDGTVYTWFTENIMNPDVADGKLIINSSDKFVSRTLNETMGLFLKDKPAVVKTSVRKLGSGDLTLQLNRSFLGNDNEYDNIITISDYEIKIGEKVVATGEFTDKKVDLVVTLFQKGKKAVCYVMPEGNVIYKKEISLSNEDGKLSFVGFAAECTAEIDYMQINPEAEKIGKVLLSGLAETGENIDVSIFAEDDSSSEFTAEWVYSDELEGEYSALEEANGLRYTVSPEYDGKFIKMIITNAEGKKEESNVVSKRLPPEAKNVQISGEKFTGEVLKGSYEFFDSNMDIEGETTFRWLRSSTEKGTYEPIDGADKINYTLTDEDIGKWLKLEITPVAENEPEIGEIALSGAFKGSVLPEAKNVKITKNAAGLYTGNYTYYHEYGAEEGNTKFEWYADGKLVSDEISYKVSSKDKKLVFKVIPVSKRAPYDGEAVETSVTVQKSSSGGGSSGGGGGMVSMPSGTTAQNVIQKVEDETRENTKSEVPEITENIPSDVKGHWSQEYVKNVTEKNIMPVDAGNNFYPDKMVTRAEIITYLFKAMGYSETEYKNEFSDVSAESELAGKLQTFVDKGIISKDVIFRPDDNVSREEVCKILSIMLGMGENDADIDKYADKDQIGDWAIIHIKNMISKGIMVGISDSLFSPKTNITNAQMAKIISVIGAENNEVVVNPPQVEIPVENIDLSSDKIKVAFIGGSLTELGESWQQTTVDALKEKLSGKKITFVNKGLGGTGSAYGAARFERDVLSFEPDIVFIEFSVNDKSTTDEVAQKRYFEEMVRMCLEAEKQPAVILVHTPSPTDVLNDTLGNWQNGVAWKDEVAAHYGIKSINIHEYMMDEYKVLEGVRAKFTLHDYYSELGYKSTGENSFDVHGGYIKYGEAVAKAINEDFDAFIRKPKMVDAHCAENKTKTVYEIIEADDSRLTFKGTWTKCKEGYNAEDPNLDIGTSHLKYFTSAIMQNSKGNASVEFATDAAYVNTQIVSSNVGNSATLFVDGVECGKINTKNANTNMNYSTGWIALPDDGKMHNVKIEVNVPTEDYVFNLGTVMTKRTEE